MKKVADTKQPIVIVQNSKPSAILEPYAKKKKLSKEEYLRNILSIGMLDLTEDYKKMRSDSRKRAKRLGI